jgi:hypothetical protein
MVKEPSAFIPEHEQYPRPSDYSFTASTRTVYTWSIGYRHAGQHRNCDGGPYLTKDGAVKAALRARGELMNIHGLRNVGRYEIQSHQAPITQPAFT